MRERSFYAFEQQQVGLSAFEAYDLENLETIPLLFQTGYLTIKEYDREHYLYTLDSVVETRTHVYIMEFKLDRSVSDALAQIHTNDYSAAYRRKGKTVIGIGVNFSGEEKRISGWEVEELS